MKFTQKSFVPIVILLVSVLYAQQGVRAQAAARIGVFEPVEAAPGVTVEVPVRVEGAEALYAVDIELRFDPALLSAEDADPASPGIQLGIADFLDPGLVLINEVDNQQGIAHFVMTQVNPSEPKYGSGNLLVLYLKGLKAGESALTVTSLQISDRSGSEIPSAGANSTFNVTETASAVSATAIPVVNPTSVQWIPTQGDANQPEGEKNQQFIPMVEAEDAAAESGTSSWLAENWWIVIAAIVVVVGLGFYLYRTR